MVKFPKIPDPDFDLRYVRSRTTDEVTHVTELQDRSLSKEQYMDLTMNSYARDRIAPKLDTKALLHMAEYYQLNCSRQYDPIVTYNEALVHLIVPELIERMKELIDREEKTTLEED